VSEPRCRVAALRALAQLLDRELARAELSDEDLHRVRVALGSTELLVHVTRP
jgi:hypothetical protein